MTRSSDAPTADVFAAIADPTRRRLIELVAERERPVRDLASAFPMSRPAVSQHLRVLREAGLVTEQRTGRERLYRLNASPLHEVSDWVRQYEQFWRARLDNLRSELETRHE